MGNEKEIEEELGKQLEKQLDNLLDPDGKNAKIDEAVERIVNETIGDIPETKVSVEARRQADQARAKAEKDKNKLRKRKSRYNKKANKRVARKQQRQENNISFKIEEEQKEEDKTPVRIEEAQKKEDKTPVRIEDGQKKEEKQKTGDKIEDKTSAKEEEQKKENKTSAKEEEQKKENKTPAKEEQKKENKTSAKEKEEQKKESKKENQNPTRIEEGRKKENRTKNNTSVRIETERRKAKKKKKKHSVSIEEEQQKKKKRKIVLVSILSVLLVALLGTYGGFAYYFHDKFFRGTSINGIEAGESTVAEIEESIRQKVENYTLTVSFRDGESESVNGSDIDYQYVSSGEIQKLKDSQHPLTWIKGLFVKENYSVDESISYDKDKLQNKLTAFKHTQPDAQVAPVNAYVTYQAPQFAVVPENEGAQLDMNAFSTTVNDAVDGSETTVDADQSGDYVTAAIKSDDATLSSQTSFLNEYASASITYQLPSGDVVLDGNTMKDWLTLDESGTYTYNEEAFNAKIKEYISTMADTVNTLGGNHTFNSTLQGTITVSGGTYGWKIDQSGEIDALTANIKNHEVVAREPVYSSREFTKENNGFGGTYVEIDLSNQHVYYYIDGALYYDTPCVSGTYAVKSRRTPGGVFTLTYKQTDRTLLGPVNESGQPSYRSHVNFWMPFNGGIGMHDASWRGSYGGTIYKYNGSHGCINMPYKAAKAFYEKIDKQTPIVCFY